MASLCESEKYPTIDEPVYIGIDEAGRGPVLGPMVYAAFIVPISIADSLKSLGFADSKILTVEKREQLFARIIVDTNFGWNIVELSAERISNCMLRKEKYNLNELSHDTVIDALRNIQKYKNIAHVWIDTVGPSEKYQKKLEALFPSIK